MKHEVKDEMKEEVKDEVKEEDGEDDEYADGDDEEDEGAARRPRAGKLQHARSYVISVCMDCPVFPAVVMRPAQHHARCAAPAARQSTYDEGILGFAHAQSVVFGLLFVLQLLARMIRWQRMGAAGVESWMRTCAHWM